MVKHNQFVYRRGGKLRAERVHEYDCCEERCQQSLKTKWEEY